MIMILLDPFLVELLLAFFSDFFLTDLFVDCSVQLKIYAQCESHFHDIKASLLKEAHDRSETLN